MWIQFFKCYFEFIKNIFITCLARENDNFMKRKIKNENFLLFYNRGSFFTSEKNFMECEFVMHN